MSKGLIAEYRDIITEYGLTPDPAQYAAVEKLQLLATRLERSETEERRSWLGAFRFIRGGESEAQGGGIYLYGGVGRGKSMLMDLFFKTAPNPKKRYIHFHVFMKEIHEAIHAARNDGKSDPIPAAVDTVTGGLSLFCFDEMQVTDITDAMILGRVFEILFQRGVAMVVTSNRHPQDLYKNGLQRERFIPFIDMICAQLDVHHLDSGRDYRLEKLQDTAVYFTPLSQKSTDALDDIWQSITYGRKTKPLALTVQGREVIIPQYIDHMSRASFADLCAKPLGSADYLAIAEVTKILFLDNIPQLNRENNNEAKRFVTLIDTLYEGKVTLICTAATAPQELYCAGEGSFEFERTASRLIEMQGKDWVRY